MQTDRQRDRLTDGLLPQHAVVGGLSGVVLAPVVPQARARRHHPQPGLVVALLDREEEGKRRRPWVRVKDFFKHTSGNL